MKLSRLSICFALLIFFGSVQLPAQSCRQLVSCMIRQVAQIQSAQYRFKQTERIFDKTKTSEVHVSLQESPKKIYVRCIHPGEGAELLYVNGRNNGKCWVKPSGFPYVSLSLSPASNRIIQGRQHHAVTDAGFSKTSAIINRIVQKTGADFDNIFKVKGSIVYDGLDCHVIEAQLPGFSYRPYTVQKGENVMRIAQKFKVSEYLIQEKNTVIDNYYDVKAGQEIMIPTIYAKKVKLYVDKESCLPIMQEMHDDKGLFERYEFLDLKLNPQISSEVFSERNPSYGF